MTISLAMAEISTDSKIAAVPLYVAKANPAGTNGAGLAALNLPGLDGVLTTGQNTGSAQEKISEN
ncbi:MAG TPA: hypothetical protein V6C72_06230, partial [Chroococcales cyanobacterium]